MFKNSIKLSLSVVLGLGILFTGCGEDSTEADAYNIEQWLDSGENQKVLDYLGDCSSYTGSAKTDCYLNVGAAYFGMSEFDMISLAQEFAKIDEKFPEDNQDDNRSKEFNKIVFSKLDNPSLKKGITYYTKVVDGNDSVCNEKDYESLEDKQQQACLSLNPVLLSNIVNDNNSDNKSETATSLDDIIEFKDALQDAVPELKSEELVSIIDGDTLDEKQDINKNNTLDSVEATSYALNVFAFSKVWDGNTSVYSEYNRSVSYTNDALKDKNITLAKIDVNSTTTSNQNIFYRLIEFGNDYNTTLTTIPDTVCGSDNKVLSSASINDITVDSNNTYLPCVKIKEDGNVTSLNDSVVSVLNNDDLLSSIALSSDSEDDTKTDDEKISDFKNDICDITGTASSINNGNCEVDSNGTITITQEAIIEYMNRDK